MAERDRNGRFVPGHSGHPSGVGRVEASERARVRELAREKTADAIEALADIIASPTASDMARVRACEAILERGWGRPSDETVLDAATVVQEGGPIRFEFVMGEIEVTAGPFGLTDDEPLALPPPA